MSSSLHCPCRKFAFSPQETEEDDEQEEQESPRRRRSIQESLSLPVPVCYPGNGQKDTLGEARSKMELCSSQSLSPSQGDSVESGGSPSLSSPKDTSSSHSPSGFMRNVKKRESKGKGKELKGTQVPNAMAAIARLSLRLLLRLIIMVSFQRS